MSWESTSFLIAMPQGPVSREGYVYRGLGMHLASAASPKGRRRPSWTLTHLGSGHALGRISGTVAEAFPIATEIAESGDWTFDGLRGWKNQFPDAPERFREIMTRHPTRLKQTKGGRMHEDTAQEIAIARAGS